VTPATIRNPATLPKAVYALFFGAVACLVPFMTLYYQQTGLTGGQIGILAGIIPLITLASSPFWGGIADATGRHKGVLLLTIAGLWFSVLILYFADGFTAMLAAVIGYAIFMGPIVPIIDNAVLNILGENKSNYGRVRLWGSVGWGLAVFLLGPLLERAGLSWSFYGFLILMAVTFVVASRLPISISGVRQSYSKGLGFLLRNGRFLLLLFVALIFGIGLGVLLSYQLIYIAELGGSRTLMALSLTISTFSEIPFWFLSSWMLRRMGVSKMIVLALSMASLRMFSLAAMNAPWLVLPISLLHGPTFAVMWSAGVAEADYAAPEGLGATAQGLFSAAATGLGAALGGFIGGPAYEAIGFPLLFNIMGWMTLSAMVIYAAFRLMPRWLKQANLIPQKPE
jgi:MFS transporter, PPP family, 3-phenylpropionic acid transporter